MTISELIAQLPAALDQVEAVLPQSSGLYPNGPRIRFVVRAPKGWIALPPVVDPVGVLWYARAKEIPSLLDGPRTAIALGLSAEDAFTLLHASDDAHGIGPVATVRQELTRVLDEWILR